MNRLREQVVRYHSVSVARFAFKACSFNHFVLEALEQAIYARGGDSSSSDRGTQYLSMRYTHRLADAAIAPSVGSRG